MKAPLSLRAINKSKFTLMGTERKKRNKTNIWLIDLGPLVFVFTSAPETQSILITQSWPELVSGKSNSVSGNYTCRVGLVQTQLRCKTRGEDCECKFTGFLAPKPLPRCPPYTLVLCNAVLPRPTPLHAHRHTLHPVFFSSPRSLCPPSLLQDCSSPIILKGQKSRH